MEVMGLMLGEFVDDYTVKVVDVFAMPQARRELSSSVSRRFRAAPRGPWRTAAACRPHRAVAAPVRPATARERDFAAARTRAGPVERVP
jgi:hypothetical protein